MNDLISRQAAIDAVRQFYDEFSDNEKSIEEIIAELPSAQRKTGRWLNHLGLPLNDFCSVCAKDSPYNKHWDYCPNCGAKMKGEQNDEKRSNR